MIYEFRDKDGNGFEVNGEFQPAIMRGSYSPSEEVFTFDQKIVERSALPGAAKIGTARLTSRSFVFNSESLAETDEDFDAYMNNLLLWIEKTTVIRDLTNNKDTKVAVQDMSISHDAGSVKRSGAYGITFTMLDSFWTDSAATISSYTLVAGVNNIVLTNTGFLKAYPLLEFTVPTPAASLDIYIDETKEGLRLVDPTLGTTALNNLVIDCVNGTLAIEGFDRTQNIVDRTGYFPIPIGESTLVIDVPVPCDLDLSYFKRYYV